MPIECADALHEIATEVLEKIAFMFAEPVDGAVLAAPEGPVVKASICFGGPMRGRIELLAALAMGQELASNMLGVEPAAVSERQARDAMGELLNVLCGQLLTRLAGTEPVFELHPPEASLVAAADWLTMLEQEDVLALMIDERPVLLRALVTHSDDA